MKKWVTNKVAKKAQTVYLNITEMIEKHGIERIGFLTLTFSDRLNDYNEAQRRFHSFDVNFLNKYIIRKIVVPELTSKGYWHYHLVIVLPWDIRTGFDLTALQIANKVRPVNLRAYKLWLGRAIKSANVWLRGWWALVRGFAPKYFFGRCETFPIYTDARSIARYIASYITKQDVNTGVIVPRGARLVRRSRGSLTPAKWSWAFGKQADWRWAVGFIVSLVDVGDLQDLFGKRWAYFYQREIIAIAKHRDLLESKRDFLLSQLSDNDGLPERLDFVISLSRSLSQSKTRRVLE